MTLNKSKLKKIIISEIKALMGEYKLPGFFYSDLDDAIINSQFWTFPNTAGDSDMNSIQGEWHNQSQAAEVLGDAIENFFYSHGLPLAVAVRSADIEANIEKFNLPVTQNHPLYPNKFVAGGQQSIAGRGRFITYLDMLPVSEDFDPSHVDPVIISKIVGNIIRHELIHVKQFEKRRRAQHISRQTAKDRFESEGEIPAHTAPRSEQLGAKIEIDAYAHQFAEELLQLYGIDQSLNILRGAIPLTNLNLSDQFEEYLVDKVPGEAAVIRLKKKMYSHIVDLADRGVYSEARKKKKKKKSKAYKEKTYSLADEKNLYLNKPTSHGGWPEGPSRSYTSNKPVNVQISDWLKSMNLMK